VVFTTWAIPISVFFTSIIGWQYFAGRRTVPAGKCYVQYMEDAVFNCILQVGHNFRLYLTEPGTAAFECLTEQSLNSRVILAHSKNELMQWRGVRRLSVRPSVNFCTNRFFSRANGLIATKRAHDGHQVSLHPECSQGQGQRSRDTRTFLDSWKSYSVIDGLVVESVTILNQVVMVMQQICTDY